MTDWESYFDKLHSGLTEPRPLQTSGVLAQVTGLALEARGIREPVGSQCRIKTLGGADVLAQVVGFSASTAYLMPAGETHGLSSGCRVEPVRTPNRLPLPGQVWPAGWGQRQSGPMLPVGDALLGRVVDANGQVLDGQGGLGSVQTGPIHAGSPGAMARDPVRRVLDTGVRSINALLTVGRGQRLGLFAGSGVGKSVLLAMMARYTAADVIVVGLIGERGREVKEFIEDTLGREGRQRSVVVAAPADCPPLLRMQGAAYATAVAEHFRDKGQHVLLLMDSLTRYAMAQREIGLAVGEAPATRGYPPSCFAKLASLVERSGNGVASGGSITAIYTVLSEGDDQQDPVADAARSILDGHIVLSRHLAEAGHYPAIDVEQSASRVMHNVVDAAQLEQARRFKSIYAQYQKSRDLIQIGAYVPGSDAATDEAVGLYPQLMRFLQQPMHESVAFAQSVEQLQTCLGGGEMS